MDQYRYENDSDRSERQDRMYMERMPDQPMVYPMLPLAVAYVRPQEWKNTYDEVTAFERGTIFPELDLPFWRGGVRK